MQAGFMKSFKRTFYIEQLRLAGVREIDEKPIELATEKQLKHALTMVRAKAS